MSLSKERASVNPYQTDFITLVNEIRLNHLGLVDMPLRSMPADSFEYEVESTIERLESTDNRLAFFMIISKFLAKLKDAHTYLWPLQAINWGPTLPLDLAWVENTLYFVQSKINEDEQLLHSRIVSFNDLSVTEFEDHVNQYISSDRNNINYLRRYPKGNTSLMVRKILFQEIGYDQDYVDIGYEKDGSEGKVRVHFVEEMIRPLINLCRNDVTRFREGNYWQVLKEKRAIYLQLNSLPVRYDSQLFDELFLTACQDGIQNLILDLRNNQGGWAGWNDEFLRYIVARRATLLIFKGWKREEDRNVIERDGYLVVEPIRRIPPFEGRIYVLVGPVTWSSGTFFAVAIKDNELGLLVGKPCGSNSIRYGHTYSIDLPNTEFRFISSSRIWERALLTAEELITPHINISYTLADVIAQRDPVFDYVDETQM